MTFFFLAITTLLFAPGTVLLPVEEPAVIKPYKKLIYAIGMVECALDTTVVNQGENAWGYFQVRQVRLDDYRKRTGISYSLKEMLDYRKAERVFIYYATKTGPYDPETIARNWNGSGPKTTEYWKKVKRHLYE